MKHNVHTGVVQLVHHAVVAVVRLLWVTRRGHPHVFSALSVEARQDLGYKHQLGPVDGWLGVIGVGRVVGIDGKICAVTIVSG